MHGDYRLGNCITTRDGTVAAVLDWEISTLGDPLADLGYLLATWSEPGDEFATISTSPSGLPGFASRADLAAHYAARTDLDCSDLPFYLAFSYWKLACINQGVWARYDAGQKSTEGVDVDAHPQLRRPAGRAGRRGAGGRPRPPARPDRSRRRPGRWTPPAIRAAGTLPPCMVAVLAAAVADRIENAIESVSGPWLYVVAGVLTFAETGTLFFLVPGEIALLVAGAAAGAGDLNLS